MDLWCEHAGRLCCNKTQGGPRSTLTLIRGSDCGVCGWYGGGRHPRGAGHALCKDYYQGPVECVSGWGRAPDSTPKTERHFQRSEPLIPKVPPEDQQPWPCWEPVRNPDVWAPLSNNPKIWGSSQVERPEACIGINLVKGRRKNVPEKEIVCILSRKRAPPLRTLWQFSTTKLG